MPPSTRGGRGRLSLVARRTPRDAPQARTRGERSVPRRTVARAGSADVQGLAVNKRKVADVRAWLAEALDGAPSLRKYRRILALTGPSGAGKSATLHALARATELHFDVVEWENCDARIEAGARQSSVERFAAFLQASARYARLALVPRGHAAQAPPPRRVILVEDWPNVSHEETRQQVHRALEQFLDTAGAPLVLIVSDALPRTEADPLEALDWRARRAAQMDVRVVVPDTVQRHPAFSEIRFAPLTTRMIQSALAAQAPHMPPAVLADVAASSGGDMRSASTSVALWQDAPTTEALAARASALVVFHAVGRVLYNKREGDPGLEAPVRPIPPHPFRPAKRASLVDIEELWAQLPVDASVYQLYLFHNLPAFANEVDEMADALEWLSEADTLAACSDVRGQAASAQYLYQLTVRGLLASLPSPVERRGQQLTKPAHWDLAARARACDDVLQALRRPPADDRAPFWAPGTTYRPAEWAMEVLPYAARIDAPTWGALAAPLSQLHEAPALHEALREDAPEALEPEPAPRDAAPREAPRPLHDLGGSSDELEDLG
ncbi:RFC checkpoint protein Rad17 [Malassezia caprae]|uniref:RFC checkpoint protein Rad17 n=1 Tax=Malassezia caprae TaxID=1381934 RepID=A0AAF0E7M7_9BASI|nr:RFC checkpoint protein Rad17 [Malassezia caprae]